MKVEKKMCTSSRKRDGHSRNVGFLDLCCVYVGRESGPSLCWFPSVVSLHRRSSTREVSLCRYGATSSASKIIEKHEVTPWVGVLFVDPWAAPQP